jgi:hypothetical chaperone protein
MALEAIERGLGVVLGEAQAMQAIEADMQRIVGAALETVAQAGISPSGIDAVYLTGGSTGLLPLAQRIAAPFGRAQVVRGDRLASVAQGLGLHAQRVFR